MKITLSTNEIADRLFNDENAGYSWAGAQALAEYLERLDEDNGEDTEFDGVAIRSDYNEHGCAVDAAEESGWEKDVEDDEDAQKEAALDWLNDRTTVIEFDGGVIVQAF